MALLKLHYKIPETKEEQFQDFDVADNLTDINSEKKIIRFAASVIMFGELLKQSEFAKNYNWDDIIRFAKPVIDMNDISQAEFLMLLEKAKKIYSGGKKKKREKIRSPLE